MKPASSQPRLPPSTPPPDAFGHGRYGLDRRPYSLLRPSPHPTCKPSTAPVVSLSPSASSNDGRRRNFTPPSPTPTNTSSTHSTTFRSDKDTDLTPFEEKFAPSKLAMLVDPKNLELLQEMGGVRGLVMGLGTHVTKGLGAGRFADSDVVETEGFSLGTKCCSGQRHGRMADRASGTSHLTSPFLSSHTPQPSHHLNRFDADDDSEDREAAYAASMDDRQRIYGQNLIPERRSKGLLQLMWSALKDKVLVLLSIAAVVSLALGFFQDFGTAHPTYSCGDGKTCTKPPVDWVEGVAIVVAIMIVVCVGSLNDYQKEMQYQKLNEKKQDQTVKVIREGKEKVITLKDVVVGDIALLEPGEIIPCDGVFIAGHNVKCDESSATGESDTIKKVAYDECIRSDKDAHADCFVISGSKVLEGVGSYVVVAVGPHSFNGRIMLALRGDTENTPLQTKLNALAELIAKLGSIVGLLLFSALLIRFILELGTNNLERSASQMGLVFIQILIISVTLIVVAVPEGLSLAVTLALAFATKRMTSEKLLVRVLGSCGTMANASVVCTDKTGTLTQNSMRVVAGSIGIHAKFVQQLKDNTARSNAGEQAGVKNDPPQDSKDGKDRRHPKDFPIDMSELNNVLSPQLRALFNEAIAVNSTAFEDTDPETGKEVFVGSKTEIALLDFAKSLGWEHYDVTRRNTDVEQMIPFSSGGKATGVVVSRGKGRGARLYLKGASEVLTKKCTRHVVVRDPTAFLSDSNEKQEMSDVDLEMRDICLRERDNIAETIAFYANQTLRTIAICYRDLPNWPSELEMDKEEVPYEELAQDLTLVAIVGVEDPLREGVGKAISNCHKAGVIVKMCKDDNVLTTRSIATQCGIFMPGGLVMEGPVFRQFNDREMFEVVPRLQALARSSPEDKKALVRMLKSLGEVVGVTGDGTNDGPALTTAHVGFSMGIAGTEVAKEESNVTLIDDNLASVVKAIMWSRLANNAVLRFLEFQVSVNIATIVVACLTAVESAEEKSVFPVSRVLWVNIIMCTLSTLAFTADLTSPARLDRIRSRKMSPLLSIDICRQILGQAMCQIVLFVFHFAGSTFFEYRPDLKNDSVRILDTTVLNAFVFNTFVFSNIFFLLNRRITDEKLNIRKGTNRLYFIGTTLIEISARILIAFISGQAFWILCIFLRRFAYSAFRFRLFSGQLSSMKRRATPARSWSNEETCLVTLKNELFRHKYSVLTRQVDHDIGLSAMRHLRTIHDLTGAVSLKEALHVVHARGGFGEIRWGKLATGQDVALKLLCIRTKTPRVLRETKRFNRETGIWSRLEHPNILPFLGIADFEDLSTCLVSPLMRNGNCRDFLDRHPHTPLLPIIRGITNGLSYLHDQDPSVVHGDLNCSNVLISDAGQPLLCDFGLAVIVEELSELPISSALQDAGNLRWMAPELLVGNATVSKASDMWALGMVFFEVMTREVPFAVYRHPWQVIMALHHGERPAKPVAGIHAMAVPHVIWNLCERCWSQKPSDRPDASFVLRCIDTTGKYED